MKIVRYLVEGGIFYGILEDNTIKQIKGNPFSRLEFTGKEEKILDVKLLPLAS